MKEEYVKPLIVFESFSLTQTIARNCGDTHDSTLGQSNHLEPNSCQWVIGEGEGAMFLFFVDACEDSYAIGDPTPEDLEDPDTIFEYGGVCYNNPDGGQEIFSSY